MFMPALYSANKFTYSKPDINVDFAQLPTQNFTMDMFNLQYPNYGRFIILRNKEFIVPFDGDTTIILIGGGAAGGRCNLRGGGGSGYIKLVNLKLIKGRTFNVRIGKSQLEGPSMDTVFGEYIATGANILDENHPLEGGSGGTGGGSGSIIYDGGRGGDAGSDGQSTSSVSKGGIGHCREEFKSLGFPGVWAGKGGAGGIAKTTTSHCGGGGGVCVDIATSVSDVFTGSCIVNGKNGEDNDKNVNYGREGQGFGAGGGAGSIILVTLEMALWDVY